MPTSDSPASWGDLVFVNKSSARQGAADMAMDESGNTVMAWTSFGPCGYTVSAVVAEAGGDWSQPEILWDSGCGQAGGNNTGHFLSVAAANGRAVVLFDRANGSQRLALFFHDFGSGWGALRPLEPNASAYIFQAQAALDPNGTATVVWNEGALFGSGTGDLYAQRMALNGTASERIVLDDTPNSAILAGKSSVLTENGTLMFAWSLGEGSDTEVRASRILPDGSTVTTVFEENTSDVWGTALFWGANAQGHQVILRWLAGGPNTASWVRTCSPEGVWSDASAVKPMDTGEHQWADFGIDEAGTVVLVWFGHGADTTNFWVQRKLAGQPWEDDVALATINGSATTGPRLLLNGSGDATALMGWRNDTGMGLAAASYSVSEDAWGDAITVVSKAGTVELGLDAGMDSRGNAVVALFGSNWTNPAEAWIVWTIRYGANSVNAPRLILSSAAPAAPTQAASFEVAGTVDPGTSVFIQGNQVPVADNGSFLATVPLQVGNNTIQVRATSASGASVIHYLTIERLAVDPGTPGQPRTEVPEGVSLLVMTLIAATAASAAVFALLHSRRRRGERP